MIQLIANGANGVLAAKPVETEFNLGKLKFQPNLEEDHVLEMQRETVIQNNAPLIANGANGVLSAKPVELEFNPGKLKLNLKSGICFFILGIHLATLFSKCNALIG